VILAHELNNKSKEAGFFSDKDVWTMAFSPPDGKYLAVGFSKFEIQIWDWTTK